MSRELVLSPQFPEGEVAESQPFLPTLQPTAQHQVILQLQIQESTSGYRPHSCDTTLHSNSLLVYLRLLYVISKFMFLRSGRMEAKDCKTNICAIDGPVQQALKMIKVYT